MATGSIRLHPKFWPIGFGFRPTEEELITHYLDKKMLGGHESLVQFIREIDLYNYDPWDLPEKSVFESNNYEWFFFNGYASKPKRTTPTGYWKSTGEARKIKARGTNEVIATRKILVFHQGRNPNGVKTNWIIHEYHLYHASNIAYQRQFVICRLKHNAEDKHVSTRDHNSGVASHLESEVTAIQQMHTHNPTNEHSVLPPPTLTDFPPAIVSNGEVNGQSERARASESDVNLTDWLDSLLVPDECFDDATSKMCRSPWHSQPDLTLMDFQPANGNDGEVNNQLLQPGPSESQLNLTAILDSVLVEDEKCDEVTSNICIDSNNNEGFDIDAAFGWPGLQNNHTFQFSFHEYMSSAMQNFSTIKQLRRSPLTAVCKYKEEKEIYCRNSYVLSGEGEARTCGISTDSYNSDHGPKICQSKSSDVLSYGVQLKKEIRCQGISQDMAEEDEERTKIVTSPQLSMKDSNNGLKSEAGNKATKCRMSCYASTESTRSVFSYILTTKRIQHNSSLPLVYVAKAFLGTVMFVMFAQEMLLFGHWC